MIRKLEKTLLIALASALITGCAVGPDFVRPASPKTDSYTPAPISTQTANASVKGGEAQHFVSGEDIPAQWWVLFHSVALDQLIRQSLARNPTLKAAQATLRQAQENMRAEMGILFPAVNLGASGTRQRISGAAFGEPNLPNSLFNLFNASVSVSYGLDIFGGTRRELEALRSQVDYERFQLEGAYLTLTSNIVTTAIKEGSLRAQIDATQNIIEAQNKQIKVVENQFTLGGASRPDVLSQRTQLAQTLATLPPLEKELAQTHHQIAVYAGSLPSEGDFPEFKLDALRLPQELPVNLPSRLARQRPDIRASEALLHEANAQIGVATANLYPQITLSGNDGSEGTEFPGLFSAGTHVWSLGASLTQPIFRGGQLRAERRAAIAARDQAAAQYQQTVLQAFQNVADALRALEMDAKTLQAQAEAASLAGETLELAQKQFKLGAVSYLFLLDAQRQYQQTRINLVQAQAARYADTAALFQALGGGWWNRAGALSDARN